jgi:beta-lactamase regulating signal transducer with metallopeptidase domain
MNAAWSALANGAVLSIPLTAAVWLTLRLIPRRALNAATRYAIWWIVLAVTIALPAFYPPRSAASGRATSGADAIVVRVVELPAATPPVDRPAPRRRLPLELPAGRWMRWLLASWLLASSVLLLRLLLSHLTVCRASARATEWRRVTGTGGRAVRLASSADVPIPVAAGPFRPSILIPAALFGALRAEELDQIVLHEAAHLTRRDDYALLLERLLEAVFSLHPVVRWIARRIDLEREIACDDLVVEATGLPRRYAACLTRMVALCGAVRGQLAVAHAAGSSSHFSQRVELLVDGARGTRSRLAAARLSGFAAALLALTWILARTPGLLAFDSPPQEIPMKPSTQLAMAAVATSLTVHAASPAPAAAPAPPPAAVQATAQTPAEKQDSGRLLLLFFDGGLSADGRVRGAAAAGNFIEKQLRPDDRVAILAKSGGSVKVLEDFTEDRDVLLKTIRQIGEAPAEDAQTDTSSTLGMLETIVKMLGSLPGKKALIYITEGGPTSAGSEPWQLQSTINAAIRANVAVYPIDARGLAAASPPR